MSKKTMKKIGIGIGVCIGVATLSMAYIGLGTILQNMYHDPESGIGYHLHFAYQCARYGYSVTFNDGWAA